MQFQADIVGSTVDVAANAEATALGAAALAGLGLGVWRQPVDILRLIRTGATYEPTMDRSTAAQHRENWRRALERAL